MRSLKFWAAPYDLTPIQRRNFTNVQIDGIAVGIANAAGPFLPVLLTRLGASNFQVGLLTSLPGITGLLLSIFIGRFLQRQRNIVPWFSGSRLLYISAYAATGLAGFFVPQNRLVFVILVIWGLATLPQTALAVSFSVVMNAVAGPNHRFDLMSRRWSILGFTTAVTVALAGKILDQIRFPLNYQIVFIGLSIGGLISFIFSSQIKLPEIHPPQDPTEDSPRQSKMNFMCIIFSNQDFIQFSIRRFVFTTGSLLATPIFPLYFVREVQASDAWIGLINTSQTAILLVGYLFWTRQSRLQGSRSVLLWATLGTSIYPALIALTHRVELIALIAGLSGIFQAGIDLVFFDELMKTIPVEYSATFVSFAQSFQHASSILAPMLGTLLADYIGLSGALLASAAIRLLGFFLFLLSKHTS